MSWLAWVAIGLFFIMGVFICWAIFVLVDRIQKMETNVQKIIDGAVFVTEPGFAIVKKTGPYSIGGRPMTKEEKEGVQGIEAIPQNKPDVPS